MHVNNLKWIEMIGGEERVIAFIPSQKSLWLLGFSQK